MRVRGAKQNTFCGGGGGGGEYGYFLELHNVNKTVIQVVNAHSASLSATSLCKYSGFLELNLWVFAATESSFIATIFDT